jgi:hypothetical protein
MSEANANYPNSVLQSNPRDTRRFKVAIKKVGVEEQKLLSNPATKVSDFVNADEATKTTANTNMEELCQPVKSGSDKEATEKPPIPEFGEHGSSFEIVRRYLCSYNIDDIRLSRLEHLERELFFIHHISPIKQK